MYLKTKILYIKFPKKFFKNFKKLKYDYNFYLNLNLKQKKNLIKSNYELRKWTELFKKRLKNKNPAIILDLRSVIKKEENKIHIFRLFNVFLIAFFGKMLSQDSENRKVISVFDRDKRKTMKKGARYHQTHEGGSIHTDNVNVPDYWDFLFFSCVAQSPIGGHSLIVDGNIVYKVLLKKFKKHLNILKKNFCFEKRGLSNSVFKSPIIQNKKGKIKYRYLRPYLESAHKKTKKPLSKNQIDALDTLDRLLENSRYQKKFKLKAYQILITQDFRILHGRTAFKDFTNAVPLNKFNPLSSKKLKRTMDRMWVKET